MDIALLLARWLLAAVFAVAGLAKLADRSGSRQALRDFGVPARLATPLGILLPWAEIAIAAALPPPAQPGGAPWGRWCACFTLLPGSESTWPAGIDPACHCFGQLSSTPVGWPTLVRNGLLAGIAGILVCTGHRTLARAR